MALICFLLLLVRRIRHSGNDLRRWHVIRIVGPANFEQIDRAGVQPESPGVVQVRLYNRTLDVCFVTNMKLSSAISFSAVNGVIILSYIPYIYFIVWLKYIAI